MASRIYFCFHRVRGKTKKGTANKRNFFELAPSRAPGQSDYVICSDFETPSRGEMGPLTETRLHTEGKVEHEERGKEDGGQGEQEEGGQGEQEEGEQGEQEE